MTPKAQTITLMRNEAVASQSLAKVVQAVTTVDERYYSHQNGVVTQHSKPLELWTRDDDGSIRFSAGLIPRVKAAANLVGQEVLLENQTRWGQHQRAQPKNLSDVQSQSLRRALQDVLTLPWGQFAISAPEKRLQAIMRLCWLFPQETTQVLVPCKADIYPLECFLAGRGLGKRLECNGQGRIAVTTPYMYATVDFWTLAIFVGPETAICDQVWPYAMRMAQQLKYCVHDGRVTLDELQDLKLEALCGPVIYSDPTDAPVRPRVTFVDATSDFRLRIGLTALDRKQAGLWHNQQRNRLVARVAQAVANRDEQALASFIPDLHQANPPLTGLLRAPEPIVLVESLEHARELKRWLPGWTITKPIESASDEDAATLPAKSIATITQLHDQAITNQVIIRATGTNSPLTASFPNGVWIIDFKDNFDTRAQSDTETRRNAYLIQQQDTNEPNDALVEERVLTDLPF